MSIRKVQAAGQKGGFAMMRLEWGKKIKRNGELQTGYAEIVRLASCRSLRLELCLDNVERTCRNARDEATACASWEGGLSDLLSRVWVETTGGPIMLLAVHFFRVDCIALPRQSGERGCMCQFRKERFLWCV